MHFHVLGPVRITADGRELLLGGPKQRLVLALLIAARGRTVSTDTLIEGVWGEVLPATARKALQGYVHHLRSEIGGRLVTEGRGYSLATNGDVDAIHFEDLRDEASRLLEFDPARSSELLREALGLWDGPAYADLSDQHSLLPEVARLENLRLAAIGDRIDADLALGRHETLTGELEGLTLEHPFQERFWAQHMTALYRAGRQTEALRSFERLRRFLADESGLDPSEELKSLQEKILSQDPSLTVEAEAEPGSDPAAIRGYELREKVASDDVSETYRAFQRSVGRQVSVRVIGPRVANDPVFISNFLADTQRVAVVDHPHISYVFDTWREPGRAYQVSRWLGGGTLEEASPGGVRSAISILTVIGDALSHAHRHGVAHGSVDASHVLFDESGHPYLSGFVVGRQQSEDDLARDQLDFAVLAHEIIGGSRPREVKGRLRPDVGDSSMERVFEVAFSDEGYRRIEDFLRALRQAAGADVVASRPESPPRTDARNPYKGLKAFQEADADDFYGRAELVDRLDGILESRRLVAVVGPSGSGKSSVVKAGLLPRLRSKSELRLFTEMYPGAFPFEELEGALLRVGIDRTSLIDDLVSDDRGLLRVLKQIIPTDESELVLIIDQFEELFSTVDDERTRKLFLDSLINAVSEPRSRLRVVITMRADFFDRPLEHPRFGETLEAGLVPITLPDDDHLAQATVMPARSEGVEFEDGLVSQIVSDVSGQPGGLPLLQYALTEMFQTRHSDVLTLAAYQRGGGVHGALGRRAEEIYQALTTVEQSSVREAFLRMVTVDEYANDLRRRVRRSDLSTIGAQTDLDTSLQAYAAARLITFDRDPVTRGPTVEVAHEALLREWDRFRGWIEEQRDDLVIRRRLDASIVEWRDSNEDPSFLVGGGRLAQFEDWASTTQLALTLPEHSYLEASRERERELQRKAVTRRRRVFAALTVAAVIAAVFGVFALIQRNLATQQAFASETARLGSEAAAISDNNYQLSLLMAVETFRRDPGFEGLGALQSVLVDAGPFLGIVGAGHDYGEVSWINGQLLIASTATEVHLLDARSGEATVLPIAVTPRDIGGGGAWDPRPHETGVRAASTAGLAAVLDESGDLHIVDGSDTSTRVFPEGAGASAVSITSDGSEIALGFDDGTIRIHDLATGAELASTSAFAEIASDSDLNVPENVIHFPPKATSGVSWLRYSPDDRRVLGVGGVRMRVFEAQTLEPGGPEFAHYGGSYPSYWYLQEPRYFWFDPSDPDVVVVGADHLVTSWRLSTGEQLSMGVAPNGRNDPDPGEGFGAYGAIGADHLLSLSPQGTVALTELSRINQGGFGEQPAPEVVLDAQEAVVRSLSIDPAGKRFAVATNDGVLIGAVDGRRLFARSVPIGLSVLPTLSRDGTALAAGLVEEGIFDLTTDPATRVRFDVPVGPLVEAENLDGYFWFRPAGEDDYVEWASEFFNPPSAIYEYPSGRSVDLDTFGSVVPSWSDDGTMVALPISSPDDPFNIVNSRIQDTRTHDSIHEIDGWVRAADFDSDGDQVVLTFTRPRPFSFSFELLGGVHLDLNTGIETALPEMPGGIFGAVFTPDDSEVIAVGGEGDVWVLDPTTMEVSRSLEPAGVSSETRGALPAISPDGRFMISWADGKARMWHLESGRQLGQPFPSQVGGVPYGVADNTSLRLVTAYEGNALIWDLDTDSWVDIACRAAGRNMTRVEWDQFGPKDTEYRATCSQYGIESTSATATSVPEAIAAMTEEEARGIVMAAFEAYNDGDFETWTRWREGGAPPDPGDGDYEVAAESRLDVKECTYRGYGEWMMDDVMTGHGFECQVTQTDLILAAAGIELAMTYVWVIGEDPNSSLGGSNEDNRFIDDFMSEYRSWLAAKYPEVEAVVEYESDSDYPTQLGVRTALQYIDDFVAQSDVYPLTEPVAPVMTMVLTKPR